MTTEAQKDELVPLLDRARSLFGEVADLFEDVGAYGYNENHEGDLCDAEYDLVAARESLRQAANTIEEELEGEDY